MHHAGRNAPEFMDNWTLLKIPAPSTITFFIFYFRIFSKPKTNSATLLKITWCWINPFTVREEFTNWYLLCMTRFKGIMVSEGLNDHNSFNHLVSHNDLISLKRLPLMILARTIWNFDLRNWATYFVSQI